MRERRTKNRGVPWIPLVILVVGVVVFWLVPALRGPVKVEVVPSQSSESR